jgi:hypothetical protein
MVKDVLKNGKKAEPESLSTGKKWKTTLILVFLTVYLDLFGFSMVSSLNSIFMTVSVNANYLFR